MPYGRRSIPAVAARISDQRASAAMSARIARRSTPLRDRHLCRAEPLDCLLESLLEANDRFVAEQAPGLADVRLRVAHVAGAGLGVNRLDVGAGQLLDGL